MDTTEIGDRQWKEGQRQGEDRVTLQITMSSRTFYRYVYRPDNKKHWQGFAKYGIWVTGNVIYPGKLNEELFKKGTDNFQSSFCRLWGEKGHESADRRRHREREREAGQWALGTHLEAYYYYCRLPTCPYNSFRSRSVSFIKDQETVQDFVTRLTAEKPLTTLPLVMWSPH